MIRRRRRGFSRPFAIAASTAASITPSPRWRSSSPRRTRSGSHASASTVPSRRTAAGAVTTGRPNTASSPAAGAASPPAVAVPPRTRGPDAPSTTAPAGAPSYPGTPARDASAPERMQDGTSDACGGRAASAAMVIGITAIAFALAASPAAARPAGAAPVSGIVPKPVSATAGSGRFTLDRSARIVAAPGAGAAAIRAERSIAGDLAAYLRPATGYPLPAVVGAPARGDIVLKIGDPAALKPAARAEGYRLDTTASSATI